MPDDSQQNVTQAVETQPEGPFDTSAPAQVDTATQAEDTPPAPPVEEAPPAPETEQVAPTDSTPPAPPVEETPPAPPVENVEAEQVTLVGETIATAQIGDPCTCPDGRAGTVQSGSTEGTLVCLPNGN